MQNSTDNATLIVGPSWVGDMVMAHSLIQRLKQQQPEVAIDVLAPPWSSPLLERMPEVRRAVAQPVGHGKLSLIQRYQQAKSLRQQYLQAIVLPNSFKSALIPFWAKIPRRLGYLGELRYGLLTEPRKLDKQHLTRTVDRFIALAQSEQTELLTLLPPYLHIDQANTDACLQKFNLNTQRPILALCPGAEYGPAKQWPVAHYAALVRHQIAQGWQVWLFGSEKDVSVGEEIKQLSEQPCINLCGKTQLAEAIDLLSLSSAVVSNDSGLMHVAAALDKPLVALYGSSDPNFTPPLSDKATILSLNLECSPCFKRTCPLGHLRCLQELTPEQVIEVLSRNKKTKNDWHKIC